MREELLQSKPPFVLFQLVEKPNTKLPFLHIYGTAHPVPTQVGLGTGKLTVKQDFEVHAMYDTGAETTRICADIL